MSGKKDKLSKNKSYWRSLEHLKLSEKNRESDKNEFPFDPSEIDTTWSRRSFISLMGASVMMATLAGCRRPVEKIIPYVKAPEEVIPGVPQHYATTMPFGNSAYGLLVESHEGRPTKIEGNPDHPSTMGMSNVFIQASILGLYDPDRSQKVRFEGSAKSWEDFSTAWQTELELFKTSKGEGLAVLSEAYSSPTIHRLRNEFEKQFPKSQWVTYEPISDENIYKGLKLAIEKTLQPVYHYDKADVILSINSDFTVTESENIKASFGFSSGRDIETENDKMNRLYVIESGFSNTGANADHRLAVSRNKIIGFVIALARKFEIDAVKDTNINLSDECQTWLQPVYDDLSNAKGTSLLVAGRNLPEEVHALVYAINDKLDNIGKTVEYHEPIDNSFSSLAELRTLSESIENSNIKTLIIFGGNPAYNAPVDFKFGQLIKKCTNSIHLSPYNDETSQLCKWHIPVSHYLENWSDARSIDGTLSVVQPLIASLYGTKSFVEILNYLATGEDTPGYELVQKTWEKHLSGDFEKSWRKVLHDGLLANSAIKATKPGVKNDNIRNALANKSYNDAGNLEVCFNTSPSVFDGRFANNGWLQELPDSITKISWDNVAQLSVKTAEKFGVANEDMIRIELSSHSLELPVWIVPGIANDTIMLELGYGRKDTGHIADNVGFNTFLLRDSKNLYFCNNVKVTRTGTTYLLANVQDHGTMMGRPIVREETLDGYKEEPEFAKHAVEHPPLKSLWTEHKYDKGNQWGMTIDLTKCTGCNACTIACQSENNIPIIGKEQVRNGREMHWIRIDRYFTGEMDNPEIVHQPVACQHCEMAPCENVCPVAATVHDKEGLNVMVYNRCVGTRYCSNNCPYKVRRFNFFNYTKDTPEVLKMANNPDVTVRSRGVMEKCTFCIQRIKRVSKNAKKENRPIVENEIVVACQQACPAKAITFGDINNEKSEVVKIKKRNRNYDLLAELNVRPRTSYLAKIRNKNPKMPSV
ncbi:MAG: TAT-variant-translocated molybdopterin oxidoreductase [bacterium]